MKKILCIITAVALVLSSATIAEAKQSKKSSGTNKSTSGEQTKTKNQRVKEKKQSFKISGSPVIKYGKYKLPIRPITQGMGATVDFNKDTAVLTVTKGTTVIVINFKEKTVTVNGVADTNSGIFKAKNDKKSTVLIKYIANKLGVRIDQKGDNITTEIPGLDLPTGVTITPVGDNVIANTLNNTTQYITASANIIAGQATGGKAELYVGSKLVATDFTISATDTTVTFTTSDESPTSAELQALITEGGVVTVKLYNADQKSVTSVVANPTLVVDYVAPTLTSINSAVYSVSGGAITLAVSGATSTNDKVDVTKISFYDSALGTSYQLTNAEGAGSVGYVNSESEIIIQLGSVDKLALENYTGSTVSINIAEGSLLSDQAGNVSTAFTQVLNVPVTMVTE